MASLMSRTQVMAPASFVNSGLFAPSARCAAVRPFRAARLQVQMQATERLRLDNLSPEKGSRRKEMRKGRGYAAGQGGTCGFGNRGQKCRSGSGPRPGFEGGQMPLYRRLPKLRGIAGGMGAGLSKYVVVNLDDLEKHFEAGQEVTLESVKEKVFSVTGRESKLPLKILADGELKKALNISAASFSEAAKQKIEAAGGKADQVAGRTKWTKKGYKALVADLASKGLDYKQEQAKKRIAALKLKGMFVEKKAAGKTAAKGKKPAAAGKQ